MSRFRLCHYFTSKLCIVCILVGVAVENPQGTWFLLFATVLCNFVVAVHEIQRNIILLPTGFDLRKRLYIIWQFRYFWMLIIFAGKRKETQLKRIFSRDTLSFISERIAWNLVKHCRKIIVFVPLITNCLESQSDYLVCFKETSHHPLRT